MKSNSSEIHIVVLLFKISCLLSFPVVEISNEIDKVSTNTSSVRNTLSNKIGTKEKERKMVFLKSPHTYAEIVKGQQYNGEINTCSMEPMTKIENMKSNNR